MSITEVPAPGQDGPILTLAPGARTTPGRRLRIVVRTASAFGILAGLVAAGGGYSWVAITWVSSTHGLEPWSTYPTLPGVQVFIAGWVTISIALIGIRLTFRPRILGRMGWAAAYVAWIAVAASCFYFAMDAEGEGPAVALPTVLLLWALFAAVAVVVGACVTNGLHFIER